MRTPIRVLLQIETCLSLTLLLLSFTGMVSLSAPCPTHRSEGVQSNSLWQVFSVTDLLTPGGTFLEEYHIFVSWISWIACGGATALWLVYLVVEVLLPRYPIAARADILLSMLGRLQGVEKVYTQRLRFMLHVANATHRRHAMGAKSTVAMARRASAMKRSSTTAAQIVEHDHRGPTLGARPPTRLHVCQSSAGRMPVICRVLARRHRPAKARPESKRSRALRDCENLSHYSSETRQHGRRESQKRLARPLAMRIV